MVDAGFVPLFVDLLKDEGSLVLPSFSALVLPSFSAPAFGGLIYLPLVAFHIDLLQCARESCYKGCCGCAGETRH